MKKLLLSMITTATMFMILGCSTVPVDVLSKDVALNDGYVNHFDKPYYEITTSEDIEDVAMYLPKDTMTIRLKLKVSNLEDIIYMKLVTEDGYEIDKILRRVEDIATLGYEQDGYMYEPSIEKNVVTLQIYVPSIYLYNGSYNPQLIFSFKRNSRSIQESVQFYFMKQLYLVSKENDKKEERPSYSNLSDYCQSSNKANSEFFIQMQKVNDNRIDLETIKDIESSCR